MQSVCNRSSLGTTALAAAVAAGGVLFLRQALRGAAAQSATPQRLRAADESQKRWLRRMRAFIFDIDGVIHVNGTIIPGAAEALAALREAGKTVVFMTNNATKTPEDVVEIFRKIGAFATPEEVMTSSIAAADYLVSRGLQGKKVYVAGMAALSDLLKKHAAVEPFGAGDDAVKTREDALRDFLPSLNPSPEQVAAVVAGTDYAFNYYKLTRASNYLRQNPACLFVATNPDPRAMLGPGTIVPGAGAMVEAIAVAAGRRPDIICGKPSESLARHMLASRKLDPETTCMVGDRTDTDIAFGRSVGMHTLFVESGTMNGVEAMSAELAQRPHYIAESIAVLRDLLQDNADEVAQ